MKIARFIITGLLVILLITYFSAKQYYSVNTSAEVKLSEKNITEGCRKFKHLAGETCIPNNPQRIITLHPATLGNILSLKIYPVGSATRWSSRDFPSYVTETIESIGMVTEPNLEKIISLHPDLIINLSSSTTLYPLLSQIAPTVQQSWKGPVQWKEHFNFVAEVLGRKHLYNSAWNNYYQRVNHLKSIFIDKYRNKRFSFVYFQHNSHSVLVTELKNVFAGEILNDVGLVRTETQNIITEDGYSLFSIEEISKIDADYIFMGVYNKSDKKFLDKLIKNPIWRTLKAVKDNHIFFVDLPTWRESNLLAANVVLDDLYKYLINPPETGQ